MKKRKSANLQELSNHFCKHPDIIRCLLEHWIRKGKIRHLIKSMDCSIRCQVCSSQFAEVYQWVE